MASQRAGDGRSVTSYKKVSSNILTIRGIATVWYTVASQVPSAGSAAEDQARVGLRRGQSRRRARIQRRDARQSLGKGLATTRAGRTTEATHDDMQLDGRCRPGEVGQCAPIVPMDAMRRLAAIGTRGGGGDHRRYQDETGLLDDQGLKRDMVIGWKQMRAQIV